MRQQALILLAAVSLSLSAAAQQTHYFPTLSLAKSYDVANLNKTVAYNSTVPRESGKPKPNLLYTPLSPKLKFNSLHQQLGADIRYLRIEQRDKGWQDAFQGLMQGFTNKSKPGL
jgi:hypothetical protein